MGDSSSLMLKVWLAFWVVGYLLCLCLPFGASFKAKSIWDDIIEKTKCCLVKWKSMYLSKGVKVILIKST